LVTRFKEEKTKAKRFAESSGRKELGEVIGTCEGISERRYNPFFLDVKLGAEILREYFPHWKSFQDHCLDAHALNMLSEVVRLHDTQLKFQSSNLYADPEFVARKIEKMSEKRLAEVFLQCRHPIAELEQSTNKVIEKAIDYWNNLSSIDERWRSREHQPAKQPDFVDSKTLVELGLQGDEFNNQLIALWSELRQSYNAARKPVNYWEFVRRASYEETVRRAHDPSYLVIYGFARLQTPST